MTGMASIHGGAHHGMATLTHAEREAARNALAKLKSSGSSLAHLDSSIRSATVYSGSDVKGTGVKPNLLQGHGSDTFIGGARTGLTPLGTGSDTVISGSTASGIIDRLRGNLILARGGRRNQVFGGCIDFQCAPGSQTG